MSTVRHGLLYGAVTEVETYFVIQVEALIGVSQTLRVETECLGYPVSADLRAEVECVEPNPDEQYTPPVATGRAWRPAGNIAAAKGV